MILLIHLLILPLFANECSSHLVKVELGEHLGTCAQAWHRWWAAAIQVPQISARGVDAAEHCADGGEVVRQVLLHVIEEVLFCTIAQQGHRSLGHHRVLGQVEKCSYLHYNNKFTIHLSMQTPLTIVYKFKIMNS